MKKPPKQKLPPRPLTEKQNTFLYILFPVLLTFLLYQNPAKVLGTSTVSFRLDPAEAAMFAVSLLLILILYAALSALTKKVWVSASILSALFYSLFVADIAKYQKLGARITIDDILMVPDIGKIWSFAQKGGGGIQFCAFYFIAAFLLITCIVLLRRFGVKIPRRLRVGRFGYITITLVLCISFSIKDIAKQVFLPQIKAFEEVSSYNAQGEAISSIDCLIGSIYSDTNPPETSLPYDEETVSHILDGYLGTGETAAIRPDVIVVLSESYFDLNQVNGVSLSEDIYKNFRRMKENGTSGKIVVPAFGGGTASTEYEVLSGTPNKGILNSKSPYRGVERDGSLWTFSSYFEDLGYRSAYIHPFKSTFYNREDTFTAMGFDTLIFEDSLTVPVEEYDRDMHISDSTFFHQIEKTLEDGSGIAPQFLFATSMQNHSPYVTLSESDRDIVSLPKGCTLTEAQIDGLNAYANGIADTDLALGEFLDYVDSRSRPTAVLFFGDHHPLLEGYTELNGILSDKTYDNLDNITTEFAIYTNYSSLLPEEKSGTEGERVSAFYLMDILINVLDLPKTPFVSFLDDAITHVPVCSMKITVGTEHDPYVSEYEDKLMLLAYDRLLGERYSIPEPPEN